MAAKLLQQLTKKNTVLIFTQKSVLWVAKKGKTGGFYANRELARIAGAKGGRISRRTKKVA